MTGVEGPFGRAHKPRGRVSDQQKRRDLALERQKTARKDLQSHARQLALISTTPAPQIQSTKAGRDSDGGSFVTEGEFQTNHSDISISQLDDNGRWTKIDKDGYLVADDEGMQEAEEKEGRSDAHTDLEGGVAGHKARDWYSKQLMTPEWMVDVPTNLKQDWYVMARPDGQRCLVISANGTTVSRLTSGRILHKFPSALPNGARTQQVAAASHVYCILDCIFHEADQTYYVIDMMSWRGYSLYNCTSEFRFYWITSKLAETGMADPPSHFHRYRFQSVPAYECSIAGLEAAYKESVPFKRDGLLFFNRNAHYSLGLTPLVLRWKDTECSQYVVDTDGEGRVTPDQLVVLELRSDGSLTTGDLPPVVLGSMPPDFVASNARHLTPGTLFRFAIPEGGLRLVEGQVQVADLQYRGISKRKGQGADSCSKILFQHAARHDPLTISDLVVSIENPDAEAAMGIDDVSSLEQGLPMGITD